MGWWIFPENVWQHGNTHILRRGLLGHIEVWIENSRIREKGTHFLFILYQLFWWSLKTSTFVKGCTCFFNLRLTPTGILVIISRVRSNAWFSAWFSPCMPNLSQVLPVPPQSLQSSNNAYPCWKVDGFTQIYRFQWLKGLTIYFHASEPFHVVSLVKSSTIFSIFWSSFLLGMAKFHKYSFILMVRTSRWPNINRDAVREAWMMVIFGK